MISAGAAGVIGRSSSRGAGVLDGTRWVFGLLVLCAWDWGWDLDYLCWVVVLTGVEVLGCDGACGTGLGSEHFMPARTLPGVEIVV